MGQIVGGSTVTSSGSRTRYFQSLTASGSFTVPDGVTTLTVTCIGGGGGGGCISATSNFYSALAGGSTAFSTVGAGGGAAGTSSPLTSGGPTPRSISGITHSQCLGRGGGGGSVLVAVGSGTGGGGSAGPGGDGQLISGTLTGLTPGSVITFTVGSYGMGGIPATSGVTFGAYGGSGSSGRIDIEWWV